MEIFQNPVEPGTRIDCLIGMRFLRLMGVLYGLLFSAPFSAFAQGGSFIIEQDVDKKVVPIAIQSDDRPTLALAQLVFSAHGGFQLAPATSAQYTLTFTPLPGDRCQARITSGESARVRYEGTANGTSPANALYRAADEAVRQITGQPGFFAGKIAFVSKRSGANEIWMSDLFFRNVKQLTSDGSNALRPYLSPNGNLLFYRGFHRTGFPDVFKVDLTTGQRTPFASYRGTNAGGAVSPNNQQVALTLSATGNMELYVAGVAGTSKPSRLTYTDDAAETSPTWSPDGQRLVFTSDQLGGPQLYEIPARGGTMTRLRTNISGYCAEANWNPRDENKLIFTASLNRGYQLALFDFATNSAQQLTRGGSDAKEAVWLNDGRHVLFTQKEGGGTEFLVILDTETGRRTRVSPAAFGNVSQPTYAY